MNRTEKSVLTDERAAELRSSPYSLRLMELGGKLKDGTATDEERAEFAEMTSFIDEMPLDRLTGE